MDTAKFPEELHLSIGMTLRNTLGEMQEIASQLYAWNWIDTTGGSLSVRLPQDPGLFALTPTHAGFNRWKLLSDGLVVLDKNLHFMPYSTSQRRRTQARSFTSVPMNDFHSRTRCCTPTRRTRWHSRRSAVPSCRSPSNRRCLERFPAWTATWIGWATGAGYTSPPSRNG